MRLVHRAFRLLAAFPAAGLLAFGAPVYTVPPGQYFMLGDNRENSLDSRSLSNFGYVPADLLMGRAVVQ
ncbi:MAG: signal peptidase I [Hyphomicrobiales bacterium]